MEKQLFKIEDELMKHESFRILKIRIPFQNKTFELLE